MARPVTHLLLLWVLVSCCSSSKPNHQKNRRSLSDLDNGNLLALDRLVREDLVFTILQKLNETARQQNLLVNQCNVKINQSVVSCQKCMSTHFCIGYLNTNNVYNGLMPILYRPILSLGHFVETIKGTLGHLAALLGNLAGGFLQSVGFVAKDLGNVLMSSANGVLSGAGSGLLDVANGLGTAASGILQGAGSVLHGIGQGAGNLLDNVGQSAGQVVSQLGHGAKQGLSELGHGVADLGGGLLHGAGSLLGGAVDALSNLFGRRETLNHPLKRTSCDSMCQMCDGLDIKLHSKEDVIVSVCGNNFLENQQVTLNNIDLLKQLYNTTITSHVLQKVQFDPTTVGTNNGVSFSSVVVTTAKNIFQSPTPLYLSDLKTTAKAIANEIMKQTLSESVYEIVV